MLFSKLALFALPILGAFAAPARVEQGSVAKRTASVDQITDIVTNLQSAVVSIL